MSMIEINLGNEKIFKVIQCIFLEDIVIKGIELYLKFMGIKEDISIFYLGGNIYGSQNVIGVSTIVNDNCFPSFKAGIYSFRDNVFVIDTTKDFYQAIVSLENIYSIDIVIFDENGFIVSRPHSPNKILTYPDKIDKIEYLGESSQEFSKYPYFIK